MSMEKKIYNTVELALKNAELHYDIDRDMIFRFGIKGEHAKYEVSMVCEEEMEFLMTSVTCSLCVPKDKIDKMCRWVVEKNYGLTLGGFKLDTSDGELTFRITCPLDKGAVNEDIVAVAYTNALSTFDNNYEEIIKAIYLDNGSGED